MDDLAGAGGPRRHDPGGPGRDRRRERVHGDGFWPRRERRDRRRGQRQRSRPRPRARRQPPRTPRGGWAGRAGRQPAVMAGTSLLQPSSACPTGARSCCTSAGRRSPGGSAGTATRCVMSSVAVIRIPVTKWSSRVRKSGRVPLEQGLVALAEGDHAAVAAGVVQEDVGEREREPGRHVERAGVVGVRRPEVDAREDLGRERCARRRRDDRDRSGARIAASGARAGLRASRSARAPWSAAAGCSSPRPGRRRPGRPRR